MIREGQRPLQHLKKVFPVYEAGIGGDWNDIFKERCFPPTAFRTLFPHAQWSIASYAMNQMLPIGKVLGIFSLMDLLSYCGLYKKTLRTNIAFQGS